jgi:adenylate cyclase
MTDDKESKTPASGRVAEQTGQPRFQIRIAYGLLTSFGGLVLLAVLVVLGLGLWSARQNTFNLLADKSLAAKEIVYARLEQHLTPAENALRHLGQQMQDGSVDVSNETEVGQYLSGALAATPQVRSIVYISENARMIFALRKERGVELNIVDISKMPVILNAVGEARNKVDVFWGDIIRPETSSVTLLNARYSVLLADGSFGLLAATVQIDQLSKILESTGKTLGGRAFVIYDENFVLAHPSLTAGILDLEEGQILPTLDKVSDPLFTAFDKRGAQSRRNRLLEEATGIRMITTSTADWAVVSSEIDRFGTNPWRIVVAFPADDFEEEFRRLRWAAIAGLRWFELYIPPKLVKQLVDAGGSGITRSRQRELTIMFTDIVGFTGISAAMSAEDTVDFLNSHFEMLGSAVEAEGGTIDKFIGDALMAFWNAPEDQPDHAARACRTAIAIRDAVCIENALRRENNLPPVRVRIGLHTGDVVVGNIGAPGRINYTIVGDAVNIANRLEQLGREEIEPEEAVIILISGATQDRIPDSIERIEIGARPLRGVDSAVTVYRL